MHCCPRNIPHFLSDLGAFLYARLTYRALEHIFESVKTTTGRALLFERTLSGTRVRVCAVEQRYSDSNEHLGDFCGASRREKSRSLVKFFQLNHLTDRLYCCIICFTARLFL